MIFVTVICCNVLADFMGEAFSPNSSAQRNVSRYS